MSKKTTLKDLGVPPKFRLTNRTKGAIIDVACRSKYGKENDEIADLELQYLSCIHEHLYPIERRVALNKAIIELNWGRPEFYNYTELALSNMESYGAISALQLKAEQIRAILTKKAALKYFCINRNTDNERKFKVEMGPRRLWGVDAYARDRMTYLAPLPVPDKVNFFWVPTPHVGNINEGEVAYCLPGAFLGDILMLFIRSKELTRKVYELQKALKEVLEQYKSVLELCELYPKFVPWIISAYELTKGETARCSDVLAADSMKKVEDILEA